MALIKCTECGKEISDKALTCPNCGCPLVLKKEDHTKSIESEILSQEKEILENAKKTNIKHSKVFAALMIVSGLMFVAFLITLIVCMDKTELFIASVVLTALSICLFIISFVFYLIKNRNVSYALEKHDNMRILAYSIGLKPTLYVEGEQYEIYPVKENDSTHYEAILPNKDKVILYFKGGKVLLDYVMPEIIPTSKVVVNNIYQEKGKKSNPERSDMEKILIKNAKIDALASIDPTNTEKSKEQIKIVKELDDLD